MKKKNVGYEATIRKLELSTLVIGIVVVIIYLILKAFNFPSINQEMLQDFISSTGVWGPLVFIAVSFLQVTFVPLPSTVTIVAGSWLFGAGYAFLYSYIGIILGSLFAFFLGRKIGRPFVNWIVGDKETVDKYLNKLKGKEVVIVFFMFLFPFFPDDALCALSGILPINWFQFIFIQLVTRATSIGGNILFASGEFIPYTETWGIITLVILSIIGIIAFIISFKYAEKIQNFFYKFIDKISFKKRK